MHGFLVKMGKGARCQGADNIQYTIYNIQCKKFQQVRGALRVNALASKQRIRNWVLVILAGLGVSGVWALNEHNAEQCILI